MQLKELKMTNTIENLYSQSVLSEASYAKFGKSTIREGGYRQDLENADFSKSQAIAFLVKYRVISHIPNTGSGFSATVFQENNSDGTPNPNGKKTIAVRGTELTNLGDLNADLNNIRMQGFALTQAIDLYNFQKSLQVSSTGTYRAAYLDVDVAKTALMVAALANLSTWLSLRATYESQGFWVGVDGTVSTLRFANSATVYGSASGLSHGQNITISGGYDVVGHSLGGHLAANDDGFRRAA
jgi:hypothetical protein